MKGLFLKCCISTNFPSFEAGCNLWEDAMTVAQHLWKAQMKFHYDSVSAASYRRAQVHRQVNKNKNKQQKKKQLSHCQMSAIGVV